MLLPIQSCVSSGEQEKAPPCYATRRTPRAVLREGGAERSAVCCLLPVSSQPPASWPQATPTWRHGDKPQERTGHAHSYSKATRPQAPVYAGLLTKKSRFCFFLGFGAVCGVGMGVRHGVVGCSGSGFFKIRVRLSKSKKRGARGDSGRPCKRADHGAGPSLAPRPTRPLASPHPIHTPPTLPRSLHSPLFSLPGADVACPCRMNCRPHHTPPLFLHHHHHLILIVLRLYVSLT